MYHLQKSFIRLLVRFGHYYVAKTRMVINVIRTHHPTSRSFLLNQSHCSFIGRKQKEMEMEEGSARVSWYERQLLIGPNHIFHRLLMEGRESFKRGIGCVILYTFRRKLVDNLLCLWQDASNYGLNS